MSQETWKTVWERKGHHISERSLLSFEDLLEADGFDSPMGKTIDATWSSVSKRLRGLLGIQPGHRLLEVGCGAGAVLSLLEDTGASLSGVDYSPPHLELARRAIPGGDFRYAEARDLPFDDGAFDSVFAHGVFLYFVDFDYADRALREMLRVSKPGRKLLVMDNPDAAKRIACEEARRTAGASLFPPHLYYPKQFFEQFAASHQLCATIFDQDVPSYANSAYRFNVLLEELPCMP
jgi:ubiquinone/menaquinone biosynthesis C-methylase UbiE